MNRAQNAGVAVPIAVPKVLSIAGTDPTGGAGIQADLKSIGANGGYGMAVTTALVAQNTSGVRSIHVPPPEFLLAQLEAVSDDVAIDSVKIGMLFDADLIAVVGEWLREVRPPCVVLDPVMVAASGDRLLSPLATTAIRALLASVDLVTPNLPELAVLVSEPQARSFEEAVRQGSELAALTGARVLVKGGHLDSVDSPDAVIDGRNGSVTTLTTPRIATVNTHGTGCSLSSAIATLRPQRGSWESAVREAKSWLTESIAAADSLGVGHGNGPISHFAGLWRTRGSSMTAADIRASWWTDIGGVRDDIDAAPFVQRLADGTLSTADFTGFLEQDALYLQAFARALATASALAPTPTEQAFWAQCARGAIDAELELHERWVERDTWVHAAPRAATRAYVNHLLAAGVHGSYTDLIAAVLPCFWLYADVGSRLAAAAYDDHPFADWLTTYADEAFARLTEQTVELVTGHAAQASDAVRSSMFSQFRISAEHELAFFMASSDR